MKSHLNIMKYVAVQRNISEGLRAFRVMFKAQSVKKFCFYAKVQLLL